MKLRSGKKGRGPSSLYRAHRTLLFLVGEESAPSFFPFHEMEGLYSHFPSEKCFFYLAFDYSFNANWPFAFLLSIRE